MGEEYYLELIYQELMDIKEDTNSINGEIGEYSQQLIYTTSGDKYNDIVLSYWSQSLLGFLFVTMFLMAILFYLFYHHIFNHKGW